jgi:hypothetical protein
VGRDVGLRAATKWDYVTQMSVNDLGTDAELDNAIAAAVWQRMVVGRIDGGQDSICRTLNAELRRLNSSDDSHASYELVNRVQQHIMRFPAAVDPTYYNGLVNTCVAQLASAA